MYILSLLNKIKPKVFLASCYYVELTQNESVTCLQVGIVAYSSKHS